MIGFSMIFDALTKQKMQEQQRWAVVRKGLQQCYQDPDALKKCIEHCEWGVGRGNTTREIWLKILYNDFPWIKESLKVRLFFSLPEDQISFWEGQMANHPFGCLSLDEKFEKIPKERFSKAVDTVSEKLKRRWPDCPYYYIRMDDISPGLRRDFEAFIYGRNRPIPDNPEEGSCAWYQDWREYLMSKK